MTDVGNTITKNLSDLQQELKNSAVELVAVSKTKPVEEIQVAYDAGQRAFGENLVQELVDKQAQLPKDIEWHQIGHLQTNKVKFIAEFIHLIHSVDSLKLLIEINKQAKKNNRVIDCLLQVFIATEESKYGLDHIELIELLRSEELAALENVRIRGLMGIATNTENQKEVKEEFYELKNLFESLKASYFRKNDTFNILSMGMSSDYKIAIEQGSTMIRLGSTLFGKRVIKHFKAAHQTEKKK